MQLQGHGDTERRAEQPPEFLRVSSRSRVSAFAMKTLKEIAKGIPGVRSAYHTCTGLALRLKSTEQVFSDVYAGNKFRGKESISGPGSAINQTSVIVTELPKLFDDFGIQTILDIPCGDFHWMKRVSLECISYIGADIVADLIQKNKQLYEKENIHFRKLDLIKDRLPRVDLILCRDCLVHLSFKDTFAALQNVCASESTYFLATTFTGRQHNHDIATGQWHSLNLEIAPFMLPPPLKTINERNTENGEAYKDKSLGLWRVANIKEVLTKRPT